MYAAKTSHPPQALDTNKIFLYFGTITFLMAVVNPSFYFMDITTTFMLKDRLHLDADSVSSFRLWTALPVYLAFIFGLARDRWNPFGMKDRGLLVLFGPITAVVLMFLAYQKVTVFNLYAGVLAVVLSTRFLVAAYQGLISLIGQEKLMSGRLSTVWTVATYIPLSFASWLSGQAAISLDPFHTFLLLAVLSMAVGLQGLWKPKQVFTGAYDLPQAKTSAFWADVRRLVSHKAIYVPVLLMFLWNFAPGSQTPLQFYLTDKLGASPAAYANFNAIFTITFLPTLFLYGYLCKRVKLRKLLFWSIVVAVPQCVPLAFIHTATAALWLAIPMGLMGGAVTAGIYDLSMRSCPAGLQGTLMLMVDGVYFLCQRLGDKLGSNIYESYPKNGFVYCVIAITIVYALMLPVFALAPKSITSTADGEELETDVAA